MLQNLWHKFEIKRNHDLAIVVNTALSNEREEIVVNQHN